MDWQQELFDLMSNEKVRLTVTGDCLAVDATLEIHFIVGNYWEEVATVSNAESFDDAMRELMEQFRSSVHRFA